MAAGKPPAKPIKECNIAELLKHPQMVQRMEGIVPEQFGAERMLRLAAQAVSKTKNLDKCDPLSLMGAFLSVGSLGLEPNTPLQHAHLIPFAKRTKVGNTWQTQYHVNVVLGYPGLIELVTRDSNVMAPHCDVVCEGDKFSFEYGSNAHLSHVPNGPKEGRKPLYAYAHIRFKDGGDAFEVWPYADVLKRRDSTESYRNALAAKMEAENDPSQRWKMRIWETCPWVEHEYAMARKTMVRELTKWMRKSALLARADQLDGMSERGRLDYGKVIDHDGPVEDFTLYASDEPEEEAPRRNDEVAPSSNLPPKAATVDVAGMNERLASIVSMTALQELWAEWGEDGKLATLKDQNPEAHEALIAARNEKLQQIRAEDEPDAEEVEEQTEEGPEPNPDHTVAALEFDLFSANTLEKIEEVRQEYAASVAVWPVEEREQAKALIDKAKANLR